MRELMTGRSIRPSRHPFRSVFSLAPFDFTGADLGSLDSIQDALFDRAQGSESLWSQVQTIVLTSGASIGYSSDSLFTLVTQLKIVAAFRFFSIVPGFGNGDNIGGTGRRVPDVVGPAGR